VKFERAHEGNEGERKKTWQQKGRKRKTYMELRQRDKKSHSHDWFRRNRTCGTSTSTSNTMNHTMRITDWTCDRSDRHRAARRDVRFYHVGVPQLKKKVYFYYSYYSFFKKKLLSLK